MEAHLFHVRHQSLSVGKPLAGEGCGRREFITAELQGDLKAVGVEVVEVLHTFRNREITLRKHAIKNIQKLHHSAGTETIKTHRKKSFSST